MKLLRCPGEWNPNYGTLYENRGFFLGGGISSCPQWQQRMPELLKDTKLTLVDPRRENFDVNDPEMVKRQVAWEYKYLREVPARMFWFPCETLCPITLFELGKFIEKSDRLFVGCHPDYQKRTDLELQMQLARPWNSTVYTSLEELAKEVCKWDACRH